MILTCLAGTSSGHARDIAAAPPVYTWTGFYIGAHAGGAWNATSWNDPLGPPFDLGNNNAGAAIGGGQIGFDYQFGAFVIGAEGTYSWTDLSGSNAAIPEPLDILHNRARWFGTVAGRVGYAATPQTLLYVKAGGAWVRNDYRIVDAGVLENIGSATHSGWLFGLGGEYRFDPSWSVKLEYNYMDFGRRRVNLTDLEGGPPVPFDIRQHIHAVLVGINYRFGHSLFPF
jgi:outer membrane immunogenic protein